MVLAAGHYKETQASAIIEAGLNVLVSVALVKKLGLYGVAVGTLVAMLYRSCYLAYYLSKSILNRPFINYIKHMLVDILVIAIIVVSTKWLVKEVNGYFAWALMSIIVLAIALVEVVIINWIIYNTEFKDAIIAFTKKSKKGGI